VDTTNYDWEGDKPLNRSFVGTVIYELHVAGFTRRRNSGVAAEKRGTYAGLIEKIPYPGRPGYHRGRAPASVPVRGRRRGGRQELLGLLADRVLRTAPAVQLAPGSDGALDEFRDLVKALHRAGIEVILDVVFNHTSEGDERGPTQSFRGLDNPTYYVLEKGKYSNFSGTGNTLHTNHAVVRRLIQDSLRYWVREMHVDGFRFDLASILARDGTGERWTIRPRCGASRPTPSSWTPS